MWATDPTQSPLGETQPTEVKLLFHLFHLSYKAVWYGMVEVCEGAPVAVSGWVLADRHDVRPCAASILHRGTISVSNIIGGTGKLGIA